ncbi:MAG TPA: outer membrane protein assembly factor BamD [Candidatus Acidoferrum sp.]|nr:outer membrane protein assembly factor BamD [Candidatus Acidoferrum sp.]
MKFRKAIGIRNGINYSLVAALVLATALAGCFNSTKNTSAKDTRKKLPPIGDSAAPDKALYERAMTDINKKRYETARLELNALINTYPETEYLAKAKLAIADSFYKEGGTGNLAQAVAQYKDFITFFPMLPEAPYAQMQVAMVHYRELAKPDRDRSEAEFAEQEFQNFLKSYPDSELAPVAAQHLREVQEVLAEGDFRIASFYMTKQVYRAAAGRLVDIANRYPLFSKSDEVLWMLADISAKATSGNLQGADKAAFDVAKKQLAAGYYGRIVQNYPLSSYAPKAKERMTALGAPVPQPDPAALARMQQEQEIYRRRQNPMSHVTGLIHNGPDVSSAARVGNPNMNPPSDSGQGNETLGEALTNMNLAGGTTAPTPGGRTDSGSIAAGGGSNTGASNRSETESNPPAVNPPVNTPPANTAANPPATGTESKPPATTGTSTANTPVNPPPDANSNPCGPDKKTDAKKGNSSGTESSNNKTNSKDKPKKPDCKESSSQKKTGIHKIIPW